MLMWLKGLLCSSRGGLRRIVLGMLLRFKGLSGLSLTVFSCKLQTDSARKLP